MPTDPKAEPETVTANAVVNFGGVRMGLEITVPRRPVPLAEFLPILRSLTEGVVAQAVAGEAAAGRTVSCRKGCGACCRQLVPITEVEARQIRDLVENLPEPRRSEIRARFAAARRRLEEEGFLETLTDPGRFTDSRFKAADLGLEYFRFEIACPFLDDESCSIHPDRPLACREYLVTSPAEHCANPSRETVRVVPLPAKVSTAVTRIGATPARRLTHWVPLILAPEWADAHPDDLPPRPGPDWLRELFTRLTGAEVPPPPP